MPGEAAYQVGPAEQQAGLRAAEELVAAGRDQVGAVAQRGGGAGLVGQQRVRGSSPEPMSNTTGTPSAGQLGARPTAAVKPSMRKFDGCTLRMNAVRGPVASA